VGHLLDTLFSRVTAVTMDERDTVLNDAYVGVRDGKIAYVGTEPPEEPAKQTISGPRRVLTPGLVNSHTHVPMAALRGLSDDENLQDWLQNFVFPTEDRFDERSVHWASQLGLADMMSTGTTSITDMYNFCDGIAGAVDLSGMRANLSRALLAFGPDFDPASDERAAETKELIDKWHGHDGGRIRWDVSVHGEYTSHERVWRWAAEYAAQRGLGMQVHLSETAFEHGECGKRHGGRSPAAVLDAAGLFDVRTTAAHCVHLTDGDMDILARRGVTAAHCPVSNLKLGSGVARIAEMRRRGVNVALGTDGVASNNSHDLFEEIKLAAIGQKNLAGPKALTGSDALRMATVNGARGQGRAGETGVIAVGYEADLILLDFDRPGLWPCLDVISCLTYAANGGDVRLTMVKGRILYRDGDFLTLDVERIRHEMRTTVLPKLGLRDIL
jgi:5-methylthioadenosine/S-adenosylhomocysteine deaminase